MTPELDHWRISNGWFDVHGRWNQVSPQVRSALRDTIDSKLADQDQDPPPPVWFVRSGEHHDLHSPCDVYFEFDTSGEADFSGITALPQQMPLGIHALVPLDGGPVTKLFVVPSRQELPRRGWGWTTQLYATRSRNSWGHGDLVDLAELARWAGNHGASLVSHNPLGDTLPISNQEPSPYFSSSRRFASLLYLRIESVPGASVLGDRLGRLTSEGRDLNQMARVDRDEVYRLKLEALREIWIATYASPATRSAVANMQMVPGAVEHATFNVLAERFSSGWTQWDRIFHDPRSRTVAEFRARHSDKVNFWLWIQSLLSEQYRSASGVGAGLMNDLPVGFTSDGSDAWVDQDSLALDWRIGAPGDEFNPDGQNWGIVPYLPQKLRAAGYEPWIRTLRRVMTYTKALRIDHVMGLFRLFLIPENIEVDGDFGPGAYLYHYGTEMLDIALLEAVRAGVSLCGEDLGTVEDGVRESLGTRNVLGYKVALFEDTPSNSWPVSTIGSISTHDLPTIAGLANGTDAKQRADAGLVVDPNDDEQMLNRIRKNFVQQAHAGSSTNPVEPSGEPDALIIDIYESLASAGSITVFASLEDACVVEERTNLPGTVHENPNWQHVLPAFLEDLDSTLAPAIASAMRPRS